MYILYTHISAQLTGIYHKYVLCIYVCMFQQLCVSYLLCFALEFRFSFWNDAVVAIAPVATHIYKSTKLFISNLMVACLRVCLCSRFCLVCIRYLAMCSLHWDILAIRSATDEQHKSHKNPGMRLHKPRQGKEIEFTKKHYYLLHLRLGIHSMYVCLCDMHRVCIHTYVHTYVDRAIVYI